VVSYHRANTATAVLAVFSAVFLGAVSLKLPSVFRRAACSDSHLNVMSFARVWNMNARRVGNTARSPRPARPLPHSCDSVSTTVQLCGADFARRTCFWAGVVNHVPPCPRPNRAGRGDLNRPVLWPDYVVCPRRCDDWRHSSGPSVGLPRTSGLNMLNSSSISSAVSHIAFLLRLLAGRYPAARPQDSNNLNGCLYRTILRGENDGWRRTQLPLRGMQAAAFTCAE